MGALSGEGGVLSRGVGTSSSSSRGSKCNKMSAGACTLTFEGTPDAFVDGGTVRFGTEMECSSSAEVYEAGEPPESGDEAYGECA